jgi:conjugative transposon TraN protein
MKQFVKKIFVCLLIVVQCTVYGYAQVIPITTDKTISLIFPFPIRHVDRGTKDIMVQVLKEPDNILLVKAASRNFVPTNLSVATTDGGFYSFPMEFSPSPATWIYRIPPQREASLESYANSLLDNPVTMHGIHDKSWNVSSRLTGIYIRNNVIYYQILLKNSSSIDYDIDFMRFYIRDKKTAKRTASQEVELRPLFVAGNISQIKSGSRSVLVFAIDKFTIPDAKFLAIEIHERNGGRNLLLHVNNRKIVKARILPDLH